MSEELKPGDTVQVKSGGASMTISAFFSHGDGTPCATCFWHDGKQKHEDWFPIVTLMKVDTKRVLFA